MILTPEEKQRIFQLRGLNPSEWDLSDDGNFTQKTAQSFQPSTTPDGAASQVTQKQKENSSALGVAGRSFLGNLIPTTGAFGAAALAEMTPMAHMLPPYSEIAVPLIAAMGGGMLTKAAQEKVLPDKVNQYLAQGQQEHPYAAIAGGVASSFPYFNPITSLRNVPTTLSGAAKLATTVPRVGRSALTDAEQQALINTGINAGVAGGQNIYAQMQSPEPFSYGQLALEAGLGGLLNEPTALGKRLFGFHGLPPNRYNTEIPPIIPQEATRSRQLNLPEVPHWSPLTKQELYEQATMSQNRNTEVPVTPIHQPPEDTQVFLDEEHNKAQNELRQSQIDLAKQQAEANRIEAERIAKDVAEKSNVRMSEEPEPISEEATQKLNEYNQQLAEKRGQTLEYQPEVLSEKSGKPIAGQINLPKREVKVSETKGSPATPIHEIIGHGVYNDLALSEAPRDQKLAQRGIDIFKDEPNPEESLAKNIEREGIGRAVSQLYGTKRERFQLWWKDVKSHLKTKFGLASDNDVINHILARAEYDAPYGTRREILAPNVRASLGGQSIPNSLGEDIREEGSLGKETKLGEPPATTKESEGENVPAIFKRPDVEIIQNINKPYILRKNPHEPWTEEWRKVEDIPDWDNTFHKRLTGLFRGIPFVMTDTNFYAKIKGKWKSKTLFARNDDGTRATLEDNVIKGEAHEMNEAQISKGLPEFLDSVTTKDIKESESAEFLKEHPPEIRGFGGKKYWQRPDGSFTDASDLHYNSAKKELARQQESPLGGNYGKTMREMLDTGYLRIIESPTEIIYDTGGGKVKPSKAQLRELRDLSIEKGKQLMDERGREIRESEVPEDYGPEIEQKLLEASFKADKEAVKSSKEENERVQTYNRARGFPVEDIPKHVEENIDYADKKAQELESFRSGANRQSEVPEISKQAIQDLIARQSTIPRKDVEKADSAAKTLSQSSDKFLSVFGSAIDKVRNLGSKTASYVSDTLEKHALLRSFYRGEYKNKIQNTISQFSPEERERVDQFGREMYANKSSDIKLSLVEKQLYDNIRKDYLEKIADENTVREIKKDPNYWPPILSRDVADSWVNHPNSAEAKQYEKDWLDWANTHSENTPEENEKILRDYQDAIGNRKTQSIEFGALRKAQGIGLPISMQDNNLMSRFSRYGERVAKDMAYYETLQSDPIMRYAMRIDDKDGNPETIRPKLPTGEEADGLYRTKELQNVNKFLFNDFIEVHQPVLRSAMRTVSSALLGFATGARNIAQIPILTAPYVGLKDIPSFFEAAANIKKGWEESFKANSRQRRLNDLEYGASENPNTWANRFNNLADALRKYQLRDLMEQGERAYEHALGESLALANFGRARNGDTKAQDWLQKFGTIVEGGVEQYFNQKGKTLKDIPQDVLNRISKSFVDRVSGTYDERGLPAGAMEGSLAPFMSLSRWNLEKSNVIYKDVVRPAIEQKNFGPLLTYTLGSILTGAAIKELNELLSNKKANEPSLKESVAANNPQQAARSVINLLQLSSYAGIVSDIMKASTDAYAGKIPQGLSFPLADFVGHTLGKNLADASTAIQQGEDKFQVATALVENILRNSVQNVRLLANYTWNRQDVDRQNKFRDLRVFNELSGQPVTSDVKSLQGNPFLDMEMRKFKRTSDLEEATTALPQLLQKAISDSKGDPYKLRKELNRIKENSYQTMPSPETYPTSFLSYLAYLRNTQGDKVAAERLSDYVKQNSFNQAKSGMVP